MGIAEVTRARVSCPQRGAPRPGPACTVHAQRSGARHAGCSWPRHAPSFRPGSWSVLARPRVRRRLRGPPRWRGAPRRGRGDRAVDADGPAVRVPDRLGRWDRHARERDRAPGRGRWHRDRRVGTDHVRRRAVRDRHRGRPAAGGDRRRRGRGAGDRRVRRPGRRGGVRGARHRDRPRLGGSRRGRAVRRGHPRHRERARDRVPAGRRDGAAQPRRDGGPLARPRRQGRLRGPAVGRVRHAPHVRDLARRRDLARAGRRELGEAVERRRGPS